MLCTVTDLEYLVNVSTISKMDPIRPNHYGQCAQMFWLLRRLMCMAIAIVASQLCYGEMREFMVVINANLLKRVLCSKGLLVIELL